MSHIRLLYCNTGIKELSCNEAASIIQQHEKSAKPTAELEPGNHLGMEKMPGLGIPMLKLWEYNIAKKTEFPGIVDFHTTSCTLTDKLCTEIHLSSND